MKKLKTTDEFFNDFDLNKYPNIKHFMLSDYQADIFFMKLLAYGWYNEKNRGEKTRCLFEQT